MSVTPEERRALLFLAFLLLAGSLVRVLQAASPRWTPELKPLFATAPADSSAPVAEAGDRETAREEPDAAPEEEAAPPSPFRAGRLDINVASAEDFAELPGIGPKLAAKIVADREANGPFARIEDLDRVSGIGPAKLARFRDAVFVAAP